MKHLYLAAAGVVVLVAIKKKRARQDANGGTMVGHVGESPILDGSNWTGDAWGRINGAADLNAPNAPNATGNATADFSRVSLSQSGAQPGWDGGLA